MSEPDLDVTATPVRRRVGVLWAVLVCAVTAAYTAIPYLTTPLFFQRGDTAAQFAPTWFHLGEMVRAGQWPPTMDTASWAGGNYAGEALFGVYNPLNVAVWWWVSGADNLAFATYVVKAAVMVLLALGTYLLAREYGSRPAAAAVVAVALPFSGFTLFWDAGSWPSGLMSFAYAPWVWVTMRRALRGVGSPFWAFLAGTLAVLNGNPYGTLAVVVIGAALILEGLVAREWGGAIRLALTGIAIAAFLPLVYIPLLETADLAIRSTGALFENSGKLRPEPGDLIFASSPLHTPPIRAITGPMKVPATFAAWFLIPLLPFLRWELLRGRAREFTGAGIIAAAYLAMTLGPSKLWLFRWPLRVFEYFLLAVFVVFAIALSAGLARTHLKTRAAASLGLILGLGWLSWSQDPEMTRRVGLGVVLLLALTLVVVVVHAFVRKAVLGEAAIAAALVLGIGATLFVQIHTFGENKSSRVWHVPSEVAQLQQRFDDLDGRVMQFTDLKPLQNKGQLKKLEASWHDYLPGSMYHPAGVDAVNNYTGMGFLPFTKRFCMEYDGFTQPCGFRNLWQPAEPGQPSLAELMKLDTVVVSPAIAQDTEAGAGWSEESSDQDVIRLVHDGSYPYEGSELSWASSGVEVGNAETTGVHSQRLEVFDAAQDGRLVFSMLGWPGWSARIDDTPLKTGYNAAGLLTVEIPAGTSGVLDLTYRTPGQRLGMIGAIGGTALALILALVTFVRRRRARQDEEAHDEVFWLDEDDHTEPERTI